MNLQDKINCENNRLERFNRFYFSFKMKKVGIAISVISTILILSKAVWDYQLLKHLLKTLFVIGLLITALSKEKVEDELMKTLRYYSFKYAFVAAIVLSLATPFIEYFVDIIFSSSKVTLTENKGFFTVFQLVILQQVYFYMLKAFYSEK